MAGKGTTYVLRPRKPKKGVGTVKKKGAPGPGARRTPKRGQARPPARKRRIPYMQIGIGLVFILAVGGSWAWSNRQARFEHAKDHAIHYFATHVHEADPSWLSLFGYMHRRFGIVATLASGQAAHDIQIGVQRPEVFEIYRRIDDPSAAVDKRKIAALPTAIDRITASALHCDRIPLPDDWVDILRRASVAGGYALTHSVLATEWTVENGCRTRKDVEGLHATQIAWLLTFVQKRHDLADNLDAATDMWIEAIAMLYYVGAGDMIPSEWLEEIVQIQNDDGGWSRSPHEDRSDPHASALALWVLLEHLRPGIPHTTWIRQFGDA